MLNSSSQLGRVSALVVCGIAAAEVLIMISPFAGFFYATQFEPLLGLLSRSRFTAWLDGFFLNHATTTTSLLLEWQRKLGLVMIGLGLAGFLLSAVQVYWNKLRKRGVAKGFLYRFVRHPQYLCLGMAGWGLLTMWPRFLLLGIWVTMLFLYAGLARFEERRMEEKFGDDYHRFADTRGAFLPGSPVHRLFEATLDRLRPRPVGWATAYVFCLALAFSTAFGVRGYALASVARYVEPHYRTVVVSAWPKPEEWMRRIVRAALSNEQVRERLQVAGEGMPLVATILPPKYGMKGMYYTMPAGQANRGSGRPLMGVDPDSIDEPVELVFSRAEKPYKNDLSIREALDADVRLTPLVVVEILPATGQVKRVENPLPRNAWGPNIVMPLF